MLRAGYADGPLPTSTIGIVEHAAHAAALLDRLGTGPATVVGHSSGTLIVLQLAQDRPDLVRRLVLSEPPLMDPLLDPSRHRGFTPRKARHRRRDGGDGKGGSARPYDAFMGEVCGPDHRDIVAGVLGPDGIARAERDSTFFFTNELPAIGGWTPSIRRHRRARPARRGRGEPARDPSPRRPARRLLPDAQVATIAGANHLLPLTHPAGLADLITSRSAALPSSSPA